MDNNQAQVTQTEAQAVANKIGYLAQELYKLIPIGATLELIIPVDQQILVPNQKPTEHRLIVSRPSSVLVLKAQ